MSEGNWRRRDLDRGKTLGVLLVVLGHIVARQDPAGSGWGDVWYEPLRAALYCFHIPFLFYLSGYAAAWSGAARPAEADYPRLLRRRAQRWLLPALAFGLAVTLGKVWLAPVLAVDHAPASLDAGLRALFWQTGDSPAQSVWYLVVLFAYAALVPLLRRATGLGPGTLFLLSLPLMPLALPPVLYADRIFLNLPFYFAGILAAAHDRAWSRFLDGARPWLALMFLGLLPVLALQAETWPRPLALALGAGVAIPALHALVRRLWLPLLGLLDWLTPYAFAIYLLNTAAIGLAKGLLLLRLPWSAAAFPLLGPLLFAAGVLGPVIVLRIGRDLRLLPARQRRA